MLRGWLYLSFELLELKKKKNPWDNDLGESCLLRMWCPEAQGKKDAERSASEENQQRVSEQIGAMTVCSGHHCCQTPTKLSDVRLPCMVLTECVLRRLGAQGPPLHQIWGPQLARFKGWATPRLGDSTAGPWSYLEVSSLTSAISWHLSWGSVEPLPMASS